MPNRLRDPENATPEPTSRTGGNGRALGILVLLAVSLFLNLAPSAFAAAKLTLQTSGGIAIAGAADDRTPISALNPPKGHTIELQQQFQSTAGEFITRIYHLRSQNVPAMSQLG